MIPDSDVPTRLSPLLTLLSSAGSKNPQHRVTKIQIILAMLQDIMSKEEAGELLDQRVHIVTSTQEVRNYSKHFVKIVGDYLGGECPFCLSMETWTHHIDRFERNITISL